MAVRNHHSKIIDRPGNEGSLVTPKMNNAIVFGDDHCARTAVGVIASGEICCFWPSISRLKLESV